MAVLLLIWAAAGLGAGVLFADTLNQWHLGGYPLGFWFAQQGSIIVFVLLILVYAVKMNRMDSVHHAEMAQFEAAKDSAARGVAAANAPGSNASGQTGQTGGTT
ncbi:MAG: putative solute:sodium symporter small subunit [Rhodothermales bacterium]|jgi:putative solute:sodium symporter small subunit